MRSQVGEVSTNIVIVEPQTLWLRKNENLLFSVNALVHHSW
jgi:hypothetical protein